MPLDLAAQVASIKNDYGATRGPNGPATFQVALFTDDPTVGGVEMPNLTATVDEAGLPIDVANGYARAGISNNGATFPAPDPTTGILTTAIISWPVSQFAYPLEAKAWVLYDGSTRWDYGVIPRDQWLYVPAAGVTPRLALSIFYRAEL